MIKTLRFLTMKRLLLFIALCCFYFGTTQTQSFDIKWNESTTFSTSDSSIEIPSFGSENYNFSHENGLIFTAQWNLKGAKID
jgi:hypothetical protein